jgi:predicted 3-demethylubiquinone-9 3-methyltransferase (glyoxalase superfamily)
MNNPIYPCLWFDGQAQEAAKFYCSVFRNSRILSESDLVVVFELNGNKFMSLNDRPDFTFNDSVSFVVECDDQEEINYYWDKLTKDGEETMCGWLKDKFGVSWQIVPTVLKSLMEDPERGSRVMQALLKMKKLDLDTLLKA